jgi:hypothetical protein
MEDGCRSGNVMSGALSCAGRRERRIVGPWQDRAVLKLSTSNTAPDYRLSEHG